MQNILYDIKVVYTILKNLKVECSKSYNSISLKIEDASWNNHGTIFTGKSKLNEEDRSIGDITNLITKVLDKYDSNYKLITKKKKTSQGQRTYFYINNVKSGITILFIEGSQWKEYVTGKSRQRLSRYFLPDFYFAGNILRLLENMAITIDDGRTEWVEKPFSGLREVDISKKVVVVPDTDGIHSNEDYLALIERILDLNKKETLEIKKAIENEKNFWKHPENFESINHIAVLKNYIN